LDVLWHLRSLVQSQNMFFRTALLSLSAIAAAKEMPKDEIKAAELYDSGIRHANNVALKKVGLRRSCTTNRGLHFPRNIGRFRRLQAPTTRRNMLRSRRRLSAGTEPPSLGVMSSDAATSVSTIRNITLSAHMLVD
jgi:hypothetical protein